MNGECIYSKSRESRADRFRRVAEARVNKIVKMIRLLGNCSHTGTYAYTQAQVVQIFTCLQSELDAAKNRFTCDANGKARRFTLQERHTPTYLKQPHIKVALPDGSHLIAAAFPDGDYPAINLYWLPGDTETEEQIALAEYNPDRESGYRLCVGAYQSDQEDTTYYEPYHGRKELT